MCSVATHVHVHMHGGECDGEGEEECLMEEAEVIG